MILPIFNSLHPIPIRFTFATLILLGGVVFGAETAEQTVLESIALSYGKVSPGFSPGRLAYTAYVPHHVDSIVITATLKSPNTTLSINAQPAQSGKPSNTIPLQTGRTVIGITVKSATDEVHYTIKVIRALPTPNWVKLEGERPWAPRDSAGELVFHDRMWLIGGYTPELVNDVWCSSDGMNWRKTGTIPNSSGVNIPVNLVYKDRMWVVCNDGAFYASSDGQTWELVTDSAPWQGRYAAGGAVFADKMWVMGGLGKGALYNDIWSSSDGIQWNLETDCAAWSKRQPFGMVAVHNEQMWLLGGGISTYHPFKAYNEIWSSPDGKNLDADQQLDTVARSRLERFRGLPRPAVDSWRIPFRADME